MRKLLLSLLLTAAAGFTHAQSSTSIPEPLRTHIFDMAGHLGLLMYECQGPIPSGADGELCFSHTPVNRERFMREWDLYHDWESQVTYTSTATRPWQEDEYGGVHRAFTISNRYLYLVTYYPMTRNGDIYVTYGELRP